MARIERRSNLRKSGRIFQVFGLVSYIKSIYSSFKISFDIVPLVADSMQFMYKQGSSILVSKFARGEGGYSTKFYTGRLRPEVQTLSLLYTIFERKVTPFGIPSVENFTPFIYLRSEFY